MFFKRNSYFKGALLGTAIGLVALTAGIFKLGEIKQQNVYQTQQVSAKTVKELEVISTDRLLLTKSDKKDVDDLVPLMMDYDVSKYMQLISVKFSNQEGAREFIMSMVKTYSACFTIKLKNTHEVIGQVGYYEDEEQDTMEVTYWLGKDYQGKGYAAEACLESSKIAFEKSKCSKLAIRFVKENEKSHKLASKVIDNISKQHQDWNVEQELDLKAKYKILSVSEKYVKVRDKTEKQTFVLNRNSIPEEYAKEGKIFEVEYGKMTIKK